MSKYTKQEVFEILGSKNEQERKEWLYSLSEQDMIDVMTLMTEVAEDIPELMANKNFADKTTNLKIDVGLFQNAVIDEQVNDIMTEIQFQADMKAADEAYQKLCNELKKHLLEDPTDQGSIEIARQFIAIEKQNEDYYKEENWKEIFHLL